MTAKTTDTAPSIVNVVLILALCNVAFFAFSTGIGPIARVIGFAPWQVGALVGASGICIMLTSRAWGRRADVLGYRGVLGRGVTVYTLVFAAMSAIVVLALNQQIGMAWTFALLIVTRCAAGISLGAIQVGAQVFVGVTSAPEKRAGAMAALGAAAGIGMVAGPALAALAASWSLSAPVSAGVLLGLLAMLLVLRTVSIPGTGLSAHNSPMSLTDARLRWPMLVAFCSMFCVIGVQINTSFYVMDRFGVSVDRATLATGIALTAVGLALISAQVLIKIVSVRRAKPWSAQAMIAGGAGLAATAFLFGTFANSVPQLAAAYFCSGFGMGFVFPGFNGLASASVTGEEQGVALGSVGAAQALGMVLGPVAATGLYHLDVRLPYWLSAVILGAVSLRGIAQLRRSPEVPNRPNPPHLPSQR